MTELKPCPFCGGKAKLTEIMSCTYIECNHKRSCLIEPNTWLQSSQPLKKQIKAWNRRAKDAELPDKMRKAISDKADHMRELLKAEAEGRLVVWPQGAWIAGWDTVSGEAKAILAVTFFNTREEAEAALAAKEGGGE